MMAHDLKAPQAGVQGVITFVRTPFQGLCSVLPGEAARVTLLGTHVIISSAPDEGRPARKRMVKQGRLWTPTMSAVSSQRVPPTAGMSNAVGRWAPPVVKAGSGRGWTAPLRPRGHRAVAPGRSLSS